jgi:hypothetical protein
MRKYPDQAPFILHFITLGYHYYMFTFDHVVPGLTELLKKEDLLAEADGLSAQGAEQGAKLYGGSLSS